MIPLLGPILGIGEKLIDRIFPDKEAQAKAKLALLEMQRNGELKELEIRMSAIIAEAKSSDKWTSRARPSFMYVIYAMILISIPMGILYAISPLTASHIQEGVQQWLKAIPKDLWWLFGAGYLGYAGARSYDKRTLLKAEKGD